MPLAEGTPPELNDYVNALCAMARGGSRHEMDFVVTGFARVHKLIAVEHIRTFRIGDDVVY